MTTTKRKTLIRGEAVRVADGADHGLRGEIGVVLGSGRDGGTRERPSKLYVVVGWRRGLGSARSAFAPDELEPAV